MVVDLICKHFKLPFVYVTHMLQYKFMKENSGGRITFSKAFGKDFISDDICGTIQSRDLEHSG